MGFYRCNSVFPCRRHHRHILLDTHPACQYRYQNVGGNAMIKMTDEELTTAVAERVMGWHQDYGGPLSISRKLSLVVQLSDPFEYEGGNLQIKTGQEEQNVRKQRGLIVAFPSYVLHQVTPVTTGSRQSLVAWVSGPAFK